MSAYGPITTSRTSLLPPTLWDSPRKASVASPAFISIHHVNRSAVEALPGLFNYLHSVFSDEVDKGLTYPQESVRDQIAFASYFFAADVLVAISGTEGVAVMEKNGVREVDLSVEQARAGRSWEECVAGFYYVKPNYPGRSSHICNAGFVVPPNQRGGGFGSVLAKSYLHYGPALGYKASVFNLVYVNNTASIRLWENLNFTKAGLIPKAGRLKRKDGQEGEEYVDAWVFYKSFEEGDCGVNVAIPFLIKFDLWLFEYQVKGIGERCLGIVNVSMVTVPAIAQSLGRTIDWKVILTWENKCSTSSQQDALLIVGARIRSCFGALFTHYPLSMIEKLSQTVHLVSESS